MVLCPDFFTYTYKYKPVIIGELKTHHPGNAKAISHTFSAVVDASSEVS